MKNFQNIKNSTFLILIIALFASCEEVIDIDLNASNPALVAEGKIFQDSLAYIRLSLTSDYFNAEPSEIIADAQVIIADSKGNTETLVYLENGLYLGSNIIGISGNTYAVSVVNNDIMYNAETTLFPPVKIYEVSFTENDMGGRPGSGGDEEMQYSMEIKFSDDPLTENFYMIKYWNNGEESENGYSLLSDVFAESDTLETTTLRTTFIEGTYKVEVTSIDEESYNYYSQLDDLSGGNMMSSSTPYNPISNFGSEVMGYFTAMSYTSNEGLVIE